MMVGFEELLLSERLVAIAVERQRGCQDRSELGWLVVLAAVYFLEEIAHQAVHRGLPVQCHN